MREAIQTGKWRSQTPRDESINFNLILSPPDLLASLPISRLRVCVSLIHMLDLMAHNYTAPAFQRQKSSPWFASLLLLPQEMPLSSFHPLIQTKFPRGPLNEITLARQSRDVIRFLLFSTLLVIPKKWVVLEGHRSTFIVHCPWIHHTPGWEPYRYNKAQKSVFICLDLLGPSLAEICVEFNEVFIKAVSLYHGELSRYLRPLQLKLMDSFATLSIFFSRISQLTLMMASVGTMHTASWLECTSLADNMTLRPSASFSFSSSHSHP